MFTICIPKNKTLATMLLLALVFIMEAPAIAGEIEWRTDYMQARQEAAQKNLPILIDFYTDNCFWCKQMDHRTFRDQTLNQTLMGNWIPLRINARKEPVLTDALRINV